MSALKSVNGDEGKELVRVLTGQEELEGLTTPKVGFRRHFQWAHG
jgi:hypothetical protein